MLRDRFAQDDNDAAWSPDGKTMSKGVTLTKEELAALKELLNNMEL
jgi:hypothetical protein